MGHVPDSRIYINMTIQMPTVFRCRARHVSKHHYSADGKHIYEVFEGPSVCFSFPSPPPPSARYCMHAQVHCGAYVTCVFVLFLAIVRSSTCIKLRIPPQLGINRFSLSSIEGLD